MEEQAELTRMTMAFAGNLRVYRKALGLTQEELAEVSGLSTNYVARLELGMSTPSFAALVKLAKALKVNVSDLLAGEERQHAAPAEMSVKLATVLEPLNEQETEYVLSQLRNSVRFILLHRKDATGG